MVAIIGLSGKAQSGKDSTVEIARMLYGSANVARVAFADGVREEARASGAWDGVTPYTPEGRTALQTWGQGKRAVDPNYWVNKAFDKIRAMKPAPRLVFIPDVRYQNEAEGVMKMRMAYDAETQTYLWAEVWRIHRVDPMGYPFENNLTPTQRLHQSETDLDGYNDFARHLVATDRRELITEVRDAIDTMSGRITIGGGVMYSGASRYR